MRIPGIGVLVLVISCKILIGMTDYVISRLLGAVNVIELHLTVTGPKPYPLTTEISYLICRYQNVLFT